MTKRAKKVLTKAVEIAPDIAPGLVSESMTFEKNRREVIAWLKKQPDKVKIEVMSEVVGTMKNRLLEPDVVEQLDDLSAEVVEAISHSSM